MTFYLNDLIGVTESARHGDSDYAENVTGFGVGQQRSAADLKVVKMAAETFTNFGRVECWPQVRRWFQAYGLVSTAKQASDLDPRMVNSKRGRWMHVAGLPWPGRMRDGGDPELYQERQPTKSEPAPQGRRQAGF